MVTVTTRVRKILESLTGWNIERIGSRSFVLLDKKNEKNAYLEGWFLPKVQLKSVLEIFDINLVIDAGANTGQFAQGLRSFYDGEIHSFEPVSSVFKELTAAASSDPNWHVHQLALGSQQSTQTISVSSTTSMSSLLKTSDFGKQRFDKEATVTREEAVSVRRLDDVLTALVPDIKSKRIFLKMDTQGYDLEVFKGLGDTLENVRALQSEVSLIPIYEKMAHWTESIAIYEKSGFGVVGMYPVTRRSRRIVEYDCLMIR